MLLATLRDRNKTIFKYSKTEFSWRIPTLKFRII